MGRRAQLSIEGLDQLSPAQLREEWGRWLGAPSPAISPELLRLALGYRLQEQRLGGLSRETRALLKAHGRTKGDEGATGSVAVPRKLSPGIRLVRDWHGTGHTVTVLERGFAYGGREWRSLTAIAKAITGAHWNGPKFFGLTGKASV
ncbi:MAG: hypothetical protein CL807_04915 [Citromicrobium sp.]|nr:hypothetical protein [Citromicrobium sp.]MAO94921.1 hypothetical protein [Citromicrobium sp.]MAS85585.1 hypothetical protein [Erythrobacteraceae bacterium]MBD76230.1 hypothetical protein [Citromicrobium sp.]MBT47391.1 hypothetical protein [Citromicrobium sp.]|tara:strand:- start:3508 stop:3948 length:441 start_codon:yes stop_codon:yes gene_type:complete